MKKIRMCGPNRNLLYIGLQALHLMIYCVLVNYAGTVLQGIGYSNKEIGLILSLGNLFGFFLQYGGAAVGDRAKKIRPIGVMAVGFCMTGVLMLFLMVINRRCISYTVIYILAMAFISMLIPLIYAYSEYLQEQGTVVHFSVARGSASVSFAIMSAVSGRIYIAGGLLPIYCIAMGIIVLVLIILYLFSIETTVREEQKALQINNLVKQKDLINIKDSDKVGAIEFAKSYTPFCWYLAGTFIIYCGTSFLQNFMIQAVEYLGGGSEQMGDIFSVGALVEIIFFFSYEKIRKKAAPKLLMKVSLMFYVLQGVLLVFAKTPEMLFLAYFVQAPAVGILIPAATDYILEDMDFRYVNRAQALFNGINLISRIFSAYFGGVLLVKAGVPGMFLLQAIISILGMGIVLCGFH